MKKCGVAEWAEWVDAVREGLAFKGLDQRQAAATLGVSAAALSKFLTQGTCPLWAVFPLSRMAGVSLTVLMAEEKFGGFSPRSGQDGEGFRGEWEQWQATPIPAATPAPEAAPEAAPEPEAYRDEDGRLHRLEGPAFAVSAYKAWYVHGTLHRVDGPAAIDPDNGVEEWYYNGRLHRAGGEPALSRPRKRAWMIHGRLHRVDGPAVEHTNGNGHVTAREYWVCGKRLTQDQWNNLQSRQMWLSLERSKAEKAIKEGGWK